MAGDGCVGMGAERVARVTYRHEAADGETYVLVSDVVELPATCRATIPDEVAPWADRTRDTPAFRGAVRLTRPGGSFAVTAATRGVVDAFVRATLVAMLACEVTVERLLVFDVAIRARGAPGVDAWGRVLDRATYRRGEVSRVTWSEPAPGEDPEVDALNAMTRARPDAAGKRVLPYAAADARAFRRGLEALAEASSALSGFDARHRPAG